MFDWVIKRVWKGKKGIGILSSRMKFRNSLLSDQHTILSQKRIRENILVTKLSKNFTFLEQLLFKNEDK